ncbi:VWA-like domain-containing protein [Paraflavitalea sp. CAU 1676]|uniref:vWA domain-containing protein n=1 Tax=Paraflavitalea sp. CAU 1676 TaxID=3032598 RepID=UPI0023DA2BDB|nr:VWA-like domain-containing protein [Paraflavitalea sp. CAU 1676]MDF2192089.1 VWA-like domain-containing protein [Paraflavitalea sp. CAU 1676]
MHKVSDDITKASIKLLIREPFYGHICTLLQRELSEQACRIAIVWDDRKGFYLRVNPGYWMNLATDELKTGVIKHQLLHLVLKHPFRRNGFGNKRIFDLAADLVVNQFLLPAQLSYDAFTIEQFGFPPNLTLEAYYRLLQQQEDAGVDNNPGDGGDGALDEHQHWHMDPSSSSALKHLMNQQVDDMITASCGRLPSTEIGKLPGGIQEYLQQIIDRFKPVVSWKRVLKLFAASARKTYLQGTLKKPSKRYGTVPGIRIRSKQRLLVAIDTSGSISAEDLAAFFQEVYHIWKQGAEVLVVECDADIQQIWTYKGKVPEHIKGGGGTDLTPPIVYANEVFRPDGLIYFTDGHANTPTVLSRAPLLWLLSPGGIGDPAWNFLPGRKVKMK